MTIYLYKKTHNKTGLQYLGKTSSPNPHKYKGSGKRWCRHINKHGYDVTTEILKECASDEEVKEWGTYYSTLWNIVDSNDWANLKQETGDGSPGKNNGMFGRTHTDEVKKASSIRRSKTNSERRWYTDGTTNKFIKECPVGWTAGRANQKPTTSGRKYYNNGTTNILVLKKPTDDEWVPGMLPKRKKVK